MSIKKLNAENAVIKTASVEVKTLTISGKQVTLAVFRQLPIKHIVSSESYDLLGIPWGRVNYSLPDKPDGEHLQLVWQEGQTLYRCWVTEEFTDWQRLGTAVYSAGRTVAVRYQTILIHAIAKQLPIEYDPASRKTEFSLNNWSFRVFALKGSSWGCSIDECLTRDKSYLNKQTEYDQTKREYIYVPRTEDELAEVRKYAIENYIKTCEREFPGRNWPYTDWNGENLCNALTQEKKNLDALTATKESYEKKWADHYELFESLDQLFIAV